MTKFEAKIILENIIFDITNEKISLDFTTDLYKDNILDSMSSFVFFMEIENRTGFKIPETTHLVKSGWYKVEKLCHEIMTISNKNYIS